MQAITGYTDQTVHAHGIDFHYLEWGDAGSPPMVLLHGLTGHAHTWDHMSPALAERYHVFALDQRGHGDTSHAPAYATSDFVEDLEALRQIWGLERFVLMGLSMGGHNAMAYAAAHPERVSRLIIIDIPPKMDRHRAPNWGVISKLAESGHRTYVEFDDAFREARAGNPTAPDENLRYRTEWNLKHVPGGMQLKYDPAAPANWMPADLTHQMGAMNMPALVVRGGISTVLSRDAAESMTAMLPDAELVEVHHSGHSVPTDRPEDLVPVVLGWLEKRREL